MNKIYDSLTKEQRKIYNHCRHSALKYFNVQKGYVLHHKDDTLMLTDVNRYIEWRPEDLVVMTLSEHSKLHNEETKQKMREAWDIRRARRNNKCI